MASKLEEHSSAGTLDSHPDIRPVEDAPALIINEDDDAVAPETVLKAHASHYRLPRFSSRRRDSSARTSGRPRPMQRIGSMFPEAKTLTEEDLSSADALMADGVFTLNSTLSSVIEGALGKPIPGMEVRFHNLELSARVPGVEAGTLEVPTLWSQVKQGLMSCGPGKSPLVTKPILRGVTGVFKPGRITLVLGQPGSGKSSLMKVLSNRFHMAKNISFSGDVHYNRLSREELLACLPRYIAYVNQIDKHYPRLTVLETFKFAHECCGGEGLEPWAVEALKNCTPEQHEYALKVANAFHEHAPELTVKKLGLDNCKDTIVGDAVLRGVSGGERKRVTTGEMMFGQKRVQLLDEISTGLDSAATFDIVKSMKSAARNFNTTVVISLLQPSPEVFELFDDVLIMNDGTIMYHGEREKAVPYFESLGFHCPPRKDVADFLLDLGTNKQGAYVTPEAAMSPSGVPVRPAEFAEKFCASDIFQETLRHLEEPMLANETQEKLVLERSPFRQTFAQDFTTLLRRQTTLTLRNKPYLVGRAVMNIVIGLLYGTTFWQMDDANSQLILGLLFSCAVFLSLSQASQVPTFLEEREVFYKQRGANFFRTAPYVLASSITQIPVAVIETIVFGSIVYWMGGYVDEVARFFVFLVTLFFCQMWFTSFFFCISATSPNLTIAQPVMMVCVLFFLLFGGFMITKDGIPDYLIWVYWIDPLAWCIRALSINQYNASKFDVCVYNGIDYCTNYGMTVGNYSLETFNIKTETVWIYYAWIYFIAGYFIFVFASYVMLEFHRYESPEDVVMVVGEEEEDSVYKMMPETPKKRADDDNDAVILINDEGDLSSEIMSTVPVDESGRGVIPVTLAFHDLWYSVPLPGSETNEEIDLLKGVSGFALPGTMTALMGSSGAGKTTLMDVIAGRKTGGRIRGKILLNGYPATDLAVRRCTGYCEQMDIHSDSATVREALTFSAFLRQDARVSDADKFASVQECIDLLELGPIADKIIRGSSTEQMKRVTIGVELAAQPSVLFMDEPTSGLDARSAKLIMNGVRKIANTGRTIVCTIHQPSTEVFDLFDSLLLLRRGGRMVYFGELGRESRKLINYFQSLPDVKPIKPGYNPATWMLECIGAGVGNSAQHDFADYFDTSELKAIMDEDLDQDGVLHPSTTLPEIRFGNKRASRDMVQLSLLCQRFFKMYWRTPTYNLTRLFVSVLLGVVFAIIYQGTDYTTYAGANAGVGLVFVSTLFLGLIGFNSVMPVAADERTAYYRERASQTYNALWYFIAGTVAEIPYVFASSMLFCIIYYPSVGFTGYSTFFYYWLIVGLNALVFVYLGQLMVYALPSVEVAATIGALLASIFMLFAGFNPPTGNIPTGYIWVHYISPPSYTISILVSLIFADCSGDSSAISCQTLSNAPPTVGEVTLKQYVEGTFSMKHDDIWRNVGITIALVVVFRALALYALRYINHLKR